MTPLPNGRGSAGTEPRASASGSRNSSATRYGRASSASRPRDAEPRRFQENGSALPSGRVVQALLGWFAENARELPWRRTRDPYAIWISEIMLQQTQVKTVIPYWERWMIELPGIEALSRARLEKVLKLWEGLGYYTRARNLQSAAQLIQQRHGGEFPRAFDEVLALPGIGRYTAGAICSIAFNQPTPVLDGNVMRVLTRLFGIHENPREREANERLWQLAATLVSRAAALESKSAGSRAASRNACSHLNQALMELGATLCTPRQPACIRCPLRSGCVAHRTGAVEDLPNLGPRTTSTRRRFAAFVVEKGGRFLVRQRPAAVVNAHLWEFPNAEITGSSARHGSIAAAAEELGLKVGEDKPIGVVKHTITRYRISLEVFRATTTRVRLSHDGAMRWHSLKELKRLPFPSAHKRILNQLQNANGC